EAELPAEPKHTQRRKGSRDHPERPQREIGRHRGASRRRVDGGRVCEPEMGTPRGWTPARGCPGTCTAYWQCFCHIPHGDGLSSPFCMAPKGLTPMYLPSAAWSQNVSPA